ncbi:POC1 centriolar protein A [Orchesella cincta]|uniref:POC1 centriolar protein A n=1 Tax=Orchesella cincta TaxID=48709 RepID=A0A1D2NA20_ORCCI|nr:POC1 centriolar protein A [Orchesella cincta]
MSQKQKKDYVRGQEPAPSLLNHYRGHRGSINSIAFHPNLETVYSAGTDGFIMSWNFRRETRALRFEGHEKPVNEVALSKDGDLMISASDDSTVRIWVPIIKGDFLSLKAHSAAVQSACFNPVETSQFATCSNDKSVKLWSVQRFKTKANTTKFRSHEFIASFSNHTNWVRSVRYSRDGRLLCTASDDKTIRVFDLRSNSCTHTLTCDAGAPTKADFNPCGGYYIGVSTTAHSFLLYDARMEKLLQSYTNLNDGPVNDFAFHPDGDFAVTVSEDAKIKILDLVEGRPIFTLYGPRTGVLATAFSPDGKLFATGGKDRELLIWEPVLLPYSEDEIATDSNKENSSGASKASERASVAGTESRNISRSGSKTSASSRQTIHSIS